jgi:hypothetical protein
MNGYKFKIGDIVTIKHGLGDDYHSSFRVDAGKRCKVMGYSKGLEYVKIKILEPTKRSLSYAYKADYHWLTAEETLEPVNRQLTFTFSD